MAEIKEIDLGPVIGPQGPKGEPGERGPEGPEGPQGKAGVVDTNTAIAFEQATQRQNIASGEKFGTILGKVAKFFSDLKAHAFEAPIQNLTTNVAGKALDAIMGKKLKEEIDTLNSSLAPVMIFTGAKPINIAEPWHPTFNFSNFSKVEFMVTFQGGSFVLPFYTYKSDSMKQSFSFNYFNQNDNKGRIVAGNMIFSGRYTDRVIVVMSLGMQDYEQIDAKSIVVNRIYGYY